MIISNTIGIVGGGQLGRMLALAAFEMGMTVSALTEKVDEPLNDCATVKYIGPWTNQNIIQQFIESASYFVAERENIPINIVDLIEKSGKRFIPGRQSLEIASDRRLEKKIAHDLGIKTANWTIPSNKRLLSGRCFLKSIYGGYDGKGQVLLEDGTDYNLIKKAMKKIGSESILEEVINFKAEASIIFFRNKITGEKKFFPIALNKHEQGILIKSTVPSGLSEEVENEIITIADKLVSFLDTDGLLAVECFIDQNNQVFLNEIAPRPHNSGHFTMSACTIDQFQIIVRMLQEYPIPDIKLSKHCQMFNIIGGNKNNKDLLYNKTADVFLYGKKEERIGRKMGHVNIFNYD